MNSPLRPFSTVVLRGKNHRPLFILNSRGLNNPPISQIKLVLRLTEADEFDNHRVRVHSWDHTISDL